MKIFFRTIHLYLSLAAGAVIMIACLTGAILVFEKELQVAFNHDRYYSSAAGNPLPLDELVKRVKQQYPEARTGDIRIWADPARNAEIGITMKPAGEQAEVRGKDAGPGKKGEKAKAGAEGGGRPTHTAFVSRTDGRVVELYSYRETFFYQVFAPTSPEAVHAGDRVPLGRAHLIHRPADFKEIGPRLEVMHHALSKRVAKQ